MIRQLSLTALVASGILATVAHAQAQQNPSFNLVNSSRLTIERAYASPTGERSWGTDRLGDAMVEPGQRFPVRLPADGKCMYDVRVEYQGGTSDERRNFNACQSVDVVFPSGAPNQNAGPPPNVPPNIPPDLTPNPPPNPGPGSGPPGRRPTRDPSFRLVNRGQTAVEHVYASITGERSWGPDRLGRGTIPGGGRQIIRLPIGECVYDVRVVFSDREALERRSVNLCEIIDFPVH